MLLLTQAPSYIQGCWKAHASGTAYLFERATCAALIARFAAANLKHFLTCLAEPLPLYSADRTRLSETSRHSLVLDAVDTVFQQQPCRLTYLHKNMEEDAAMHRFPRPLVLCACVHIGKILLPPLATAGCGEERMKVALYIIIMHLRWESKGKKWYGHDRTGRSGSDTPAIYQRF